VRRVIGLHAFQKKAKTGRKTPAHEMDLVRRRLRVAEEDNKRLTKGE
jgi:phage-related protein